MYGNERRGRPGRRGERRAARGGLPDDEAAAGPRGTGTRRRSRRASHALGVEYVDLWLIHWPPGGRARPDVWERLLELQAEGLARDVGVSNYSLRQIDELERATGRLPAVNQIEWSPALFDARRARRAPPPRRAARGLQPTQDDEPPRPSTRARSRMSTASPRRRSSSAGTSSTGSWRSRSPRTPSASPRTPHLRLRADAGRGRAPRRPRLSGSPRPERRALTAERNAGGEARIPVNGDRRGRSPR